MCFPSARITTHSAYTSLFNRQGCQGFDLGLNSADATVLKISPSCRALFLAASSGSNDGRKVGTAEIVAKNLHNADLIPHLHSMAIKNVKPNPQKTSHSCSGP